MEIDLYDLTPEVTKGAADLANEIMEVLQGHNFIIGYLATTFVSSKLLQSSPPDVRSALAAFHVNAAIDATGPFEGDESVN